MYKICFYVPLEYAEAVKEAVFATGAGKIGHYSHCAWQTEGLGQFLPLEGSQAFIGNKDHLEKIPEYKVELVCEASYLEKAIAALKSAHPYETPAYQVIKLEDF